MHLACRSPHGVPFPSPSVVRCGRQGSAERSLSSLELTERLGIGIVDLERAIARIDISILIVVIG